MKKFYISLALIVTTISSFAQTPAITMTTTIPVGNNFSFTISTLNDNTPIQVDWGNGSLTSYTIIGEYYWVSSALTGSTIKIYGQNISALMVSYKDLTSLDVSISTWLTKLVCSGNKLSSLNVSTNLVLTELNCQYNNLTTLDLSKNANLTKLECSGNQINALDISQNILLTALNCSMNQLTNLNVTKNNALITLDCSMNKIASLDISKNLLLTDLNCHTNWIRELDLSKNTKLKILTCAWNGLSVIDVSMNTALEELGCSNGQITYLDVSKNIALKKLYCTESQLTTIDVSKNTALKVLACSRNQIESLDLSKNTELLELYCSSNQLFEIDLSANTALTKCYCDDNHLSVFDISKNTSLTHLDCSSNLLKFNTLPIKQSLWIEYTYSPQKKVSLPKKKYTLVETIDLSSQLTINNNTTNYTWKTKGGTTLTSGTDYTIIGGITTFLKGQTDSVYCQMTNATLPLLTLSTTNIKVSDPTSIESDFKQITKVYPNPISNLLWVASEEIIKRIEIYTVVGTKVFEQDYNSSQKVNINAAELPKGLLIVKVYGMNSVMEKKILKE